MLQSQNVHFKMFYIVLINDSLMFLLITATRLPASICLIDVRLKTMIAYYNRTDELCRIDAITFNPQSAELVVSVTLYEGKL